MGSIASFMNSNGSGSGSTWRHLDHDGNNECNPNSFAHAEELQHASRWQGVPIAQIDEARNRFPQQQVARKVGAAAFIAPMPPGRISTSRSSSPCRPAMRFDRLARRDHQHLTGRRLHSGLERLSPDQADRAVDAPQLSRSTQSVEKMLFSAWPAICAIEG